MWIPLPFGTGAAGASLAIYSHNNGSSGATANSSSCTLDVTGCNMVIVFLFYYNGSTLGTPSDGVNTYSLVTSASTASSGGSTAVAVFNTTFTSGTQTSLTIQYSTTNSYPLIYVFGITGSTSLASSGTSNTSYNASVTPSVGNLMISGVNDLGGGDGSATSSGWTTYDYDSVNHCSAKNPVIGFYPSIASATATTSSSQNAGFQGTQNYHPCTVTIVIS